MLDVVVGPGDGDLVFCPVFGVSVDLYRPAVGQGEPGYYLRLLAVSEAAHDLAVKAGRLGFPFVIDAVLAKSDPAHEAMLGVLRNVTREAHAPMA